MAGKHVADMSKMEAEKQSLQKQYNDLVARITELSKVHFLFHFHG